MSKITDMFGNKADPFRDAIEAELKSRNIHNVRGVGGVFDMKDASQISEGVYKPFQRATVILADTSTEKAIPMLAGELRDGGIGIISLANMARPNDIRELDRFDARRMAHQGRERLHVFGTQTAPEFRRILNP